MIRLAGLAICALLCAQQAAAEFAGDRVKIGILTDASGVYADFSGEGARIAAEMAVADFGGSVVGKPIELRFADHRNRTSIALDIAQRWFDTDGVDMILDLTNSAVALAVQDLARSRNRIVIVTGAGSAELTGRACSPTAVHYVYDSYALVAGTAAAMVAEGGDSWFYLTADYSYGHAIETESAAAVIAAGGRVLGRAKHPIGIHDFSAFVDQANASGARIVGLASSGADTMELVRQTVAAGLTQGGRRVAALMLNVDEVHRLGLEQSHGIIRTTAFYWDRNEATRAFAARFFAVADRMPTMAQAGDYSAVMHYLRAVGAAGTDRAAAVMAKMRAMPINDFFATDGHIRADGRMVHDMYLVEVKTPAESQAPWDYYRILKTIPGEQAFRPLGLGGCPLVARK
jgi:branched-chain amino acid transport system substrate-binding protein